MVSKRSSSISHRRGKLILVMSSALLIVAALVVGISDNPPGITLLYAASVGLVLAWALDWRRPAHFTRLLLAGVAGFLVFAALHNLAYAGAEVLENVRILHELLQALSVAFFLVALFLCPAAILVGFGGLVATMFIGRGRSLTHHG